MTVSVEVSTIIVTYNSCEVINSCLNHLLRSENCSTQAIVVDNASQDTTAAEVQSEFPDVQLIKNSHNRGFSAANNQAIPLCVGRYIYFLNPDTQAQSDALASAVDYMDANPKVGIAGSHIVQQDGPTQDSVSFRYPGQRFAGSELDGLPGSIASVLGAAMIARADLIRRLRGFDEEFFLYGEDEDLCLRVRKAGYSVGFIPESVVMHIGGHSEQNSSSAEVWRKKIKAETIFQRKHYSASTAKRIRRANLARCRWRLLMLSLCKTLRCSAKGADVKIAKYRAIHDALSAVS